jgi:hypothetical protein
MTNSLIPFIGVTGGIGSGKSMICRIFSCLGIPVFEADKEAKIILNENEMVKKSIKELLGNQAYTDNEVYNPTWVRAIINEDPTLIPLINSIVHPAVRQKAIEWQLSQKNKPFLVYESALIHGKNKPEIITKLIVGLSIFFTAAFLGTWILMITLQQQSSAKTDDVGNLPVMPDLAAVEETILKLIKINLK